MNQQHDAKPLRDFAKLDRFFESLAAAPARVLLLDYDGTLAPFRAERDQAVPYEGLREILRELLGAAHTRMVLISGRHTKDLIPLLGLIPPPEVWGSHGWERFFADGKHEVAAMPEPSLKGLANADEWIESHRLEAHRENKPGCLALHFRDMPKKEANRIRKQALEDWAELAQRSELELTEFDGGLELRVPGRSKGDAVRTILEESPEGTAVAFLGDDLTDEDAFAALGGRGLKVLVRPEFRPTLADVWLKPPDELFDFLRRWQQSAGDNA